METTITPPVANDQQQAAPERVDGSSSTTKPSVEVVSVKQATRAIDKVEKDLADYHYAQQLTDLEMATNEEEVGKIVMRRASANMFSATRDNNRLLSFSDAEVATVALAASALLPVLYSMIPGIDFIGAGSAGGLHALIAIIVASTLSVASIGLGVHPYPQIRNKVILRKQFKRYVRLTTQTNKANAERNERLLKNKQKKLERAQRRVKEMAVQYEEKNPGKTLRLSANLRSVESVDKEPLVQLSAKEKLARELAGQVR